MQKAFPCFFGITKVTNACMICLGFNFSITVWYGLHDRQRQQYILLWHDLASTPLGYPPEAMLKSVAFPIATSVLYNDNAISTNA